MELKPGYRQTPVGIIPTDWAVAPLRDLCQKIQDGTHFSPQIRGGEYMYITSKNIGFGTLDIANVPRISQNQHAAIYRRCDVKPDDVLLTKDGANTGNATINTINEEFSLLSSVAFLRFDTAKHNPIYFLQQILSFPGQRQIKDAMSGNAITRLTLDKINRLLFSYPSITEQRAIATALNDVDRLLGELDKLIVKKRDVKQAAMQQLLTGQTRLPGFTGEWETKRLGDHLRFLRNGTNSRAELTTDGTVRYLHYGDIHACAVPTLTPVDLPFILPEKVVTLDRLVDGDLVFADASEDMEGVCKSVEIQGAAETELVSGLHTIAARFDKSILADGFKAYLQFYPEFSRQLRRLAAGTKVYAVNSKHIASIEIRLPNVNEQTAIAAVLTDMDAEIGVLEQRRTKTADLKQGMMQQLLTGKIRLVQPDATEQDMTEKKGANIHFKRSVLAAEIISRLHNEPTFGHVKFEKMIFLVEHLCGVDTGSTYHRQAAGPYDNRALRSIDSQIKKQKWFEAKKQDGRYHYVPLDKSGEHAQYFDRYFSGIRERFDGIIAKFKSFDTERCEIVATLYGAWNDLIRQGNVASDDAILIEVLDKWHKSKRRISRDRWQKALAWMRENNLAPQGGNDAQ